MRERLVAVLKLFIFWVGVMQLARLVFLIYNFTLTAQLDFSEMLLAMLYGMRMDLSMAGYWLTFNGLLILISFFTQHIFISKLFRYGTFVFLFVTVTLVTIDAELYRHWGFRMNTTPLFYMGSAATGNISIGLTLFLLLILILLFVATAFWYHRWIHQHVDDLKVAPKKFLIIWLLLFASNFLLIRGSFSVAPMNTGFVYFHKTKMYANHAAINVVWNFFKSLSRTSHIEYPENFYAKEKTNRLFDSLYRYSAASHQIFTKEKPNIILIIVESYTAQVIEALGGEQGITPRLNEWMKEGISFSNFYASGDRTDKGLVAILSAYPAQPQSSIIKYPQKTQHLPFLNRHMQKLGYHTSFTYGGDADFANFRSYLTASGFDAITDVDDFPDSLDASKWGVHDGFMLDKAWQEVEASQSPFFKVILTQSSHEPFDVPAKPFLPPTDEKNLFLNSCHYTDSCLGAFLDKLKSSKQWENTVVLLTADHGHRLPGNLPLQHLERFRIPFLITGGAISKKNIGNQTDIANTLLTQLQAGSKDFIFSKNLLADSVTSFSASYFNDGFLWVSDTQFAVYDNVIRKFIEVRGNQKQIEAALAHQQKLYSDYNKR
ncbi:MAG: LTA synthase family protein [Flammeovirgaceae bacterium]|nr:LTA synthase family protein [Flammeovirgaceae bacterium]